MLKAMRLGSKKMLSILKSIFFLFLALFFAIGYQYAHSSRIDFYHDGIDSIATIESTEGQFLVGRKFKKVHYNYWVTFDGYRFHYQWPEKYAVGEKLYIIYDPEKPSQMKPTTRVENNKNSEWKVFLAFGVACPILFLWLSYLNFQTFKLSRKSEIS
jgi:hypothetical protein